MRIASLVPSATEALFALGLGEQVVGVTHECDFPEAATTLPQLTASVLPPGLSAGEIDAKVRELVGRGEALYRLDTQTLAALEVDLIVTQAVCAVCAVSYDDVCRIAGSLPSGPRVLSLDPNRIADMLDDLEVVAEAVGHPPAGKRLRAGLVARLDAVRTAVGQAVRPRVVALEWLDPPYLGGHWVPEMIDLAGGIDPLVRAGERSRTATWKELEAAHPEVVVAMPCGLYADQAAAEARSHAAEIAVLQADRVYAVDAASSFSRPGPRLVDGVELLGHLLHPDLVPPPATIRWRDLSETIRPAAAAR